MDEIFIPNNGSSTVSGDRSLEPLETLVYERLFQSGGSDALFLQSVGGSVELLEGTESTSYNRELLPVKASAEESDTSNNSNKYHRIETLARNEETFDVVWNRGVNETASSNTSGMATQEGVFSHDQVCSIEGPLTFFIAGRGGETNFHPGNIEVRKRICAYREEYLQLSSGARGKKLASKLLQSKAFCDVRFVVKVSYFKKNQDAKKISATRIFSVLSEHGQDKLGNLDETDYVSVGADWAQGIIVDLLRSQQAPSRSAVAEPATATKRCEPEEGFPFTNLSPKKRRRAGQREQRIAAQREQQLESPEFQPENDSNIVERSTLETPFAHPNLTSGPPPLANNSTIATPPRPNLRRCWWHSSIPATPDDAMMIRQQQHTAVARHANTTTTRPIQQLELDEPAAPIQHHRPRNSRSFLPLKRNEAPIPPTADEGRRSSSMNNNPRSSGACENLLTRSLRSFSISFCTGKEDIDPDLNTSWME